MGCEVISVDVAHVYVEASRSHGHSLEAGAALVIAGMAGQ